MSTFSRPMASTLFIHKTTLPFGHVNLFTNLQGLMILRSHSHDKLRKKRKMIQFNFWEVYYHHAQ